MLKGKLQKATRKALHIVERTPAASAMMAVAMGAAALSSCSYEGYKDSHGRWYEVKKVNINSVGGGNRNGWFDVNGNGGGGSYWGGVPMSSSNRGGGWVPGLRPGERFGRMANGVGVITPAQHYMVSQNAKNQELVTKKAADGSEWQVAKGTKLPKNFMVVVSEGRTIPVSADQYNHVTAALKKGELNFVVDANGEYGLVPQAAANEVKTGTLTFKEMAKMAKGQKKVPTQGKGR